MTDRIEQLYSWKDSFAEIMLYKDYEDGFTKLNINNGLQFMERDEHRYHQSVFMLPSLFVPKAEIKVLILGGGDGLGARELVKMPHVKSVDLVDISEPMIFMSSSHPDMTRINNNSLKNKKVNVNIMDSNIFIQDAIRKKETWDLIVLDYPDPSVKEDSPINSLFSEEHYKEVSQLLSKEGIISIQSTSVYISPNVYEKISLNISKFTTSQLKLIVNIQSYGDIGIIVARNNKNDNAEWNLHHEIPKKAFFNEQSISKFTMFLEDEKPTLRNDIIEEMSIPNLIKYDISADFRKIENNFFTNDNVKSPNRLIAMSTEEALRTYQNGINKKYKTVKDVFVNNSYLLGYPNCSFVELDENDSFFQNLDIIRDKDGYISTILKVRIDEEFLESEYIYTNNIANSISMYKLYYKYLDANPEKPLVITYWAHNPLTQNVVDRFNGEIIDKGFTWNIPIDNIDINNRPKEDLREDLGELGYFSYNGILGSWETNWVETKNRLPEIIAFCRDRNIPNLAIFSSTPPVEYDYFLYKVAKLDFSKNNPKMSKTLKNVLKKIGR